MDGCDDRQYFGASGKFCGYSGQDFGPVIQTLHSGKCALAQDCLLSWSHSPLKLYWTIDDELQAHHKPKPESFQYHNLMLPANRFYMFIHKYQLTEIISLVTEQVLILFQKCVLSLFLITSLSHGRTESRSIETLAHVAHYMALHLHFNHNVPSFMSKSIFPFSMSAVLLISQKVDHLNNTKPQITTYVYQTCVCAAVCDFLFFVQLIRFLMHFSIVTKNMWLLPTITVCYHGNSNLNTSASNIDTPVFTSGVPHIAHLW